MDYIRLKICSTSSRNGFLRVPRRCVTLAFIWAHRQDHAHPRARGWLGNEIRTKRKIRRKREVSRAETRTGERMREAATGANSMLARVNIFFSVIRVSTSLSSLSSRGGRISSAQDAGRKRNGSGGEREERTGGNTEHFSKHVFRASEGCIKI